MSSRDLIRDREVNWLEGLVLRYSCVSSGWQWKLSPWWQIVWPRGHANCEKKRSQLRAWYLGRTWICKILVDTDVRMCCQFNSDWMLSWIYFFFFYYFVWLVIQEHSKQHNLHTSCYNGRNLYVCRLNRINRGILLTTLDLKDYKNTFRLQLFLPVFCIFLPCHSRRLNIMMNILGKTESKTDVPVHDCTCWRFQENK